jgi:hypothetical protein
MGDAAMKGTLKRLLAAWFAAIFLLASVPPVFARGSRGGSNGVNRSNSGPGGGGGGGGEDGLVLRVNPAIGAPGGLVAVVVRTYAPRPVRQGQIIVPITQPTTALQSGLTFAELTKALRPFSALVSARVFSQAGDAASQAALSGQLDGQSASVGFQSPTGGVNAVDGPLAVFFLRLDPSVKPGQTFALTLDPAQTGLTDSQGLPIQLALRGDALTVRASTDPILVRADGDKVLLGQPIQLSVDTLEPFPVSSGRITLTWDPRIAGGPPTVTLDPRYGKATFTTDASRAGRLVVSLQSPDASFNTVPGAIVAITLPPSGSAQVGDKSNFAFDPAGTWLVNPQGKKLGLRLANGVIEVQ